MAHIYIYIYIIDICMLFYYVSQLILCSYDSFEQVEAEKQVGLLEVTERRNDGCIRKEPS